MLKEAICSYFKDQEESVIKNWGIAKSEHDFDALHDLRVGIKRMKSLYQILDPMTDGNFDYKKKFEYIRFLFKAAGKLRDIQVISRLFQFFAKETLTEELEGFKLFLQEKEEIESDQLNLALLNFNPELIKNSYNDTEQFLENCSEKKALKRTLKLLKKRLKQINSLLPNKKDNELMHEMRTRAKQTYYIIEILKLIRPEFEPMENPKEMKLAGDLLGQWHDHDVLCLEIKNYLKSMKSEQDFNPELYKELLKRIKKEGSLLLKMARKVLKSNVLKLL